MKPTVGSLFSGIGGLDLGLERAGWEVRWQAENDPYCSRVLTKHWPDVPNLGDVTTIDWTDVERVDLICGGYPCQPFSLAGARRGTDDERHLWPRMRDAIGFLRPRLALLENVPGHLSMGFGDVLGDLADLGYDAEWDCIPAAAVGAPHQRYRVFVVGYASERGRLDSDEHDGEHVATGGRFVAEPARVVSETGSRQTVLADAERTGLQRRARSGTRWARILIAPRRESGRGEWSVEPDVGRVAHGVPSRVDRLRALGNAVVPQVAEFIGTQLLNALDVSEYPLSE